MNVSLLNLPLSSIKFSVTFFERIILAAAPVFPQVIFYCCYYCCSCCFPCCSCYCCCFVVVAVAAAAAAAAAVAAVEMV